MMIITMWNFIVIQFELLFKEELQKFGVYITIVDFAFLLLITYFPIVSLIGRYDFKHPTGAVKVEQELFIVLLGVVQKTLKLARKMDLRHLTRLMKMVFSRKFFQGKKQENKMKKSLICLRKRVVWL